MTRERTFGSDTEFCKWMRANKSLPSYSSTFGFVASDNDLTVHRYITSVDSIGTREVQGLMHVEIKTRKGLPSNSQIDTLSKLNLFCGDRKVGGVSVRLFGVFVLVMTGASPDDSHSMWWGAIPKDTHVRDAKSLAWNSISVDNLVEILRFDCHPRNLSDKTPFRRHHKNDHFIETETTPLGFEVSRLVAIKS